MINLSLSELESGSTLIGGAKDRRLEIEHQARRREPLAISPIRSRDGSKTYSAIAPTGEVDETPRGPIIKFRPIWCRLFTINSMFKNSLTRLACEFDFGKYIIDVNGVQPANLTMSGPGTDPRIVSGSETALGKILEEEQTSDLSFQLQSFIKRSF
jgi:hypothetical protein